MRIKVDIGNSRIRRPLRMLVAHHARQTVRRLKELLPRVSVTLSEVVGAKDGLGKRCVVEMTTGKSGPVVMSSTARTWQAAIKLALRRASERLTALSRLESPAGGSQKRVFMVRRPMLR